MVCATCAARLPTTTALATPAVKRRHDIASAAASKPSGITKSKLLTSRKNPYAAAAATAAAVTSAGASAATGGGGGGAGASCRDCAAAIGAADRLCQRCAFKRGACRVCGRGVVGAAAAAVGAGAGAAGAGKRTSIRPGAATGAQLVQGQRFSAK